MDEALKLGMALNFDESSLGQLEAITKYVREMQNTFNAVLGVAQNINSAMGSVQSSVANVNNVSNAYGVLQKKVETVNDKHRLIQETYKNEYGYVTKIQTVQDMQGAVLARNKTVSLDLARIDREREQNNNAILKVKQAQVEALKVAEAENLRLAAIEEERIRTSQQATGTIAGNTYLAKLTQGGWSGNFANGLKNASIGDLINLNGQSLEQFLSQTGKIASLQTGLSNLGQEFITVSAKIRSGLGNMTQVTGLYNQTTNDMILLNQKNTSMLGGLTQVLGHNITKMLEWTAAGAIIFGTIRLLKSALDTITDVETSIIHVQRVLINPSNFDMGIVVEGARNISETYGKSLTDTYSAMEGWARRFKDVHDVVTMTNESIKLVTVTDMDLETSFKGLSGVMAQFELQVADASHAVDVFNELSNNMRTTAQDIVEGLDKVGSASKNMGVDIDRSSAMIATMVETLGTTGSQAGTVLNRMFSRVSTDKVVAALKDINVEVGRPLGKTLDDLGLKWDSLTKAEQENISKSLGGTYHWQKVMGLFNNYNRVIEATIMAYDSFGSAQKEIDLDMSSFTKKTEQLKATWQSFTVSSGNAGILSFLKTFVDGLRIISQFMDNLNKVTKGWLGTILLLIGAVWGLYAAWSTFEKTTALGKITTIVGSILSLIYVIGGLTNLLGDTQSRFDKVNSELDKLAANTSNLSEQSSQVQYLASVYEGLSNKLNKMSTSDKNYQSTLETYNKVHDRLAKAIANENIGITQSIKNKQKEQSATIATANAINTKEQISRQHYNNENGITVKNALKTKDIEKQKIQALIDKIKEKEKLSQESYNNEIRRQMKLIDPELKSLNALMALQNKYKATNKQLLAEVNKGNIVGANSQRLQDEVSKITGQIYAWIDKYPGFNILERVKYRLMATVNLSGFLKEMEQKYKDFNTQMDALGLKLDKSILSGAIQSSQDDFEEIEDMGTKVNKTFTDLTLADAQWIEKFGSMLDKTKGITGESSKVILKDFSQFTFSVSSESRNYLESIVKEWRQLESEVKNIVDNVDDAIADSNTVLEKMGLSANEAWSGVLETLQNMPPVLKTMKDLMNGFDQPIELGKNNIASLTGEKENIQKAIDENNQKIKELQSIISNPKSQEPEIKLATQWKEQLDIANSNLVTQLNRLSDQMAKINDSIAQNKDLQNIWSNITKNIELQIKDSYQAINQAQKNLDMARLNANIKGQTFVGTDQEKQLSQAVQDAKINYINVLGQAIQSLELEKSKITDPATLNLYSTAIKFLTDAMLETGQGLLNVDISKLDELIKKIQQDAKQSPADSYNSLANKTNNVNNGKQLAQILNVTVPSQLEILQKDAQELVAIIAGLDEGTTEYKKATEALDNLIPKIKELRDEANKIEKRKERNPLKMVIDQIEELPGVAEVLGTALDNLKLGIDGVIDGTKTWGEVIQGLGSDLITSVMNWGISRVFSMLFGGHKEQKVKAGYDIHELYEKLAPAQLANSDSYTMYLPKTIDELNNKLKNTSFFNKWEKLKEGLGTTVQSIADSLASAFDATNYQDFLVSWANSLESMTKEALIKAFLATRTYQNLYKSLSDTVSFAVMDGVLTANELGMIRAQSTALSQQMQLLYQSLAVVDQLSPYNNSNESESGNYTAGTSVPITYNNYITIQTMAFAGDERQAMEFAELMQKYIVANEERG